MPFTTNPDDPGIKRGIDKEPTGQHEKYLVLSDAERRKGFVRPLRKAYRHVGIIGPQSPLRDLTEDEHEKFNAYGYAKFEPYPSDSNKHPAIGKFWTQEELDKVNNGCGKTTTMARELAETYARDPKFYGATYCYHCSKHLPVDEFVWDGTDLRVGS